MSASKFGYPNIKVGKMTNEQNMQDVKSYLYEMSDNTSRYIINLENEVEELKKELAKLRSQ